MRDIIWNSEILRNATKFRRLAAESHEGTRPISSTIQFVGPASLHPSWRHRPAISFIFEDDMVLAVGDHDLGAMALGAGGDGEVDGGQTFGAGGSG